MDIDFIELGKYCQAEYKASLDGKNNKYSKTIFVAIKEDNNILVSTTPHILAQAKKCILIHERSCLAITNWYSWYMVQFINEKGEVFVNRIDEEFELYTVAAGGFDNQELRLSANQVDFFSHRAPFENCIQSLWNLYIRLKKANTQTERKLIASLFKSNQKVLELEKLNQDFKYKTQLLECEKNMYKEMLDSIKELLNKNKEE